MPRLRSIDFVYIPYLLHCLLFGLQVNHSPDVPVDAPSALDVQQLISNLQNSKRELGVLLHEPSNAGSSRLLADISSTIQDISLAIESDQE